MAGKVPTYSGDHPAGCRGGHPCRLCRWPVHHKADGCRTQHHGGPPTPAGHSRRRQAMPGHPIPTAPPRLESSLGGCQPRQHQAVDGVVAGRRDQGRSRPHGQGRLYPCDVRGGGAGQRTVVDPGASAGCVARRLGLRSRAAMATVASRLVGVSFPAGGCWEIIGQVGAARLTLVNFVIRV